MATKNDRDLLQAVARIAQVAARYEKENRKALKVAQKATDRLEDMAVMHSDLSTAHELLRQKWRSSETTVEALKAQLRDLQEEHDALVKQVSGNSETRYGD